MRKILNIGSINIDYVYTVPSFVCSGETIASLDRSLYPGGKGLNQSIALARAGGQVWHAGCIGKDGEHLLSLLRDEGINTEYIGTNGSSTGHAIIQVTPEGQNCILLHGGANKELTLQDLDDTFSHFGSEDILVLQNEVNEVPYLIEKGSQKDMFIVFNPSPITEDIMQYAIEKVALLVLNEVEAGALTGKSEPDLMLLTLRKRYPETDIVLTLGESGVIYRGKMGEVTHGIYNVPVIDTTAAGDTFTGYYVSSSLVRGNSVSEALRLASVASSIAVSKKGASSSIPKLEEVLNASLNQ